MLTQIKSPCAPRPFLKWAGGKTQLLQQYQDLLPKRFENYYEPFLGGGAVFFNLYATTNPPVTSFLMDINLELINVYRCVRDDVQSLIDHLEIHRVNHAKEYYYEIRGQQACPDVWFENGNNLERAARFIYLNKTCFNGLYRENSKGHFNVPMGSYKNPPILDPDLLNAASASLQNASIEAQSFEVIAEHATTAKDFVYFDPPYFPISDTSKFTSYSRGSFNMEDQIRLRDTFATLAKRRVKVMLSNSDCPFIRDLYQDFKIHTIQASRHINSKASKRGKITEVLVTSY
ncbi:DNA adenine methylase [filamentous cyanobacterium LEGE 11480]|uniref:Site-specific DNA-methyltransferase (adenine-specific) n=1 Tax=Romeriopsis navalis LEGE 11480 TaxID=2777977 RepID=A0A928Z1I8_9CYAN|nr:DNA adenine methylase [Romeriopsis navalis]MBE9028549.1 DNA adenine methylase [Romeriopsis navalis LEGE 11480]